MAQNLCEWNPPSLSQHWFMNTTPMILSLQLHHMTSSQAVHSHQITNDTQLFVLTLLPLNNHRMDHKAGFQS